MDTVASRFGNTAADMVMAANRYGKYGSRYGYGGQQIRFTFGTAHTDILHTSQTDPFHTAHTDTLHIAHTDTLDAAHTNTLHTTDTDTAIPYRVIVKYYASVTSRNSKSI